MGKWNDWSSSYFGRKVIILAVNCSAKHRYKSKSKFVCVMGYVSCLLRYKMCHITFHVMCLLPEL